MRTKDLFYKFYFKYIEKEKIIKELEDDNIINARELYIYDSIEIHTDEEGYYYDLEFDDTELSIIALNELFPKLEKLNIFHLCGYYNKKNLKKKKYLKNVPPNLKEFHLLSFNNDVSNEFLEKIGDTIYIDNYLPDTEEFPDNIKNVYYVDYDGTKLYEFQSILRKGVKIFIEESNICITKY